MYPDATPPSPISPPAGLGQLPESCAICSFPGDFWHRSRWVRIGGFAEQFRRALVFLRRAFGSFSPQEKRQIAENLGQCWGLGADSASELIEQPLTEKEEEKLKELNDFDFGDL